jgi:alcohol dehydrogenase
MALADQVFDFFIPSVTKMGIGAVKQLGATANFLGGTKALLITDKGMVEMGVADQMKKLLEDAGVQTVISGAGPNPRT